MNTTTAEIRVDENELREFEGSLGGQLTRPPDATYDDQRKIWNGSIDRRPALIARCTGVADVIAAMRFAREQGLPVALRSGGHSYPGLSVCDAGMVIDLGRIKCIRVDPEARTARAQAGVLLGSPSCRRCAPGLRREAALDGRGLKHCAPAAVFISIARHCRRARVGSVHPFADQEMADGRGAIAPAPCGCGHGPVVRVGRLRGCRRREAPGGAGAGHRRREPSGGAGAGHQRRQAPAGTRAGGGRGGGGARSREARPRPRVRARPNLAPYAARRPGAGEAEGSPPGWCSPPRAARGPRSERAAWKVGAARRRWRLEAPPGGRWFRPPLESRAARRRARPPPPGSPAPGTRGPRQASPARSELAAGRRWWERDAARCGRRSRPPLAPPAAGRPGRSQSRSGAARRRRPPGAHSDRAPPPQARPPARHSGRGRCGDRHRAAAPELGGWPKERPPAGTGRGRADSI